MRNELHVFRVILYKMEIVFLINAPKVKKTEYCGICDTSFYLDYDGICVGYDGTKDTSIGGNTDEAKGNKIESALLIALIAFLI